MGGNVGEDSFDTRLVQHGELLDMSMDELMAACETQGVAHDSTRLGMLQALRSKREGAQNLGPKALTYQMPDGSSSEYVDMEQVEALVRSDEINDDTAVWWQELGAWVRRGCNPSSCTTTMSLLCD